MLYAVCTFIVLISTTLEAQDLRVRPQFEVASVKPASRDQTDDPDFAKVFREARRNRLRSGEIPMTGPNRVLLRDWPLLDLIAAAYGLRTTQVSGPNWLFDKAFDIEARVPDGASKADLNAMLQLLLEERFSLRVHRITETKQGFAITVRNGGPKLTPAVPPSGSSPKLTEQEQDTQTMQSLSAIRKRLDTTSDENKSRAGVAFLSWSSITLEELAHQLGRLAEAPVVDETGLTGKYSVTIDVSQNPDGGRNAIFDAVEELGLKLEPRKVPTETLVVDQASKAPTPN